MVCSRFQASSLMPILRNCNGTEFNLNIEIRASEIDFKFAEF